MKKSKNKDSSALKINTQDNIKLQNKLIELGQAISKAIGPISDLQIKLLPNIDELPDILDRDCNDLIDVGWFFTEHETPAEVHELANIKREKGNEALNSAIISMYENDNWNLLEKRLNSILSYPEFSFLGQIINECLWAHRLGKYHLSIIAGLTVVESMIASASNKLLTKDKNVKNQWNKTVKALGEMDTLLKKPFSSFLDKLFGSMPLDKSAPTIINRHWIMHRLILITPGIGTKTNSLRILLAIVFIGEAKEREKI